MRYVKRLPGFRSGSRWKMAVASAAYLLLVLAVIGLFVDTGSEPGDTASAAAPPTATVAPTTPSEPTATAEPTATPEAASDYVAEAGNINRSVVNALNDLATLGDGIDGPVEDWRLDIDVPVGMLQLAYVQAQRLDAPDEYADFHANWLAALALLDEAAALITEGLDSNTDAPMYAAGELIDEAAVMMRDGPQLP